MGIFKLKIWFGIFGKKPLVTVDGPPDKIIPFMLSKLSNESNIKLFSLKNFYILYEFFKVILILKYFK